MPREAEVGPASGVPQVDPTRRDVGVRDTQLARERCRHGGRSALPHLGQATAIRDAVRRQRDHGGRAVRAGDRPMPADLATRGGEALPLGDERGADADAVARRAMARRRARHRVRRHPGERRGKLGLRRDGLVERTTRIRGAQVLPPERDRIDAAQAREPRDLQLQRHLDLQRTESPEGAGNAVVGVGEPPAQRDCFEAVGALRILVRRIEHFRAMARVGAGVGDGIDRVAEQHAGGVAAGAHPDWNGWRLMLQSTDFRPCQQHRTGRPVLAASSASRGWRCTSSLPP